MVDDAADLQEDVREAIAEDAAKFLSHTTVLTMIISLAGMLILEVPVMASVRNVAEAMTAEARPSNVTESGFVIKRGATVMTETWTGKGYGTLAQRRPAHSRRHRQTREWAS